MQSFSCLLAVESGHGSPNTDEWQHVPSTARLPGRKAHLRLVSRAAFCCCCCWQGMGCWGAWGALLSFGCATRYVESYLAPCLGVELAPPASESQQGVLTTDHQESPWGSLFMIDWLILWHDWLIVPLFNPSFQVHGYFVTPNPYPKSHNWTCDRASPQPKIYGCGQAPPQILLLDNPLGPTALWQTADTVWLRAETSLWASPNSLLHTPKSSPHWQTGEFVFSKNCFFEKFFLND